MLVPSNRLLFWSAMTLIPAALLATFAPQSLSAAALLAALLLAAASLDAWRAVSRLDGLAASVPEVTRLSCGREGEVGVTLAVPAALRGRRLRVALDADEEAGLPGDARECALPAGADRARLAWPCRPVRRGLYGVRLAACEADAPWRLWHVVRRLPMAGELRVYPDLRQERRSVPAVFLRRGEVGVHMHRMAGKGREFEKLREYVPGDDLGDIHWKATARRRFPVTKAFQLERTQEAYVVLDVSRLSGRTIGDGDARTVLDQYIRSALTLVLAAERLGDRCGLVVFHRRVVTFLPAGSGKRHFDACRNALYAAAAEPVSPDFRELFAFLRARVRKRALLLFLTHLDNAALADPFLESARLVTRQHLLAVPLLTPRETRPALSGEPPADEDDAWRELAGHLQWRRLKELERRLRACGARTALAPAGKATATLIALYRAVKERQLL
jgi:uncharacterized protein (DUF58 family)